MEEFGRIGKVGELAEFDEAGDGETGGCETEESEGIGEPAEASRFGFPEVTWDGTVSAGPGTLEDDEESPGRFAEGRELESLDPF